MASVIFATTLRRPRPRKCPFMSARNLPDHLGRSNFAAQVSVDNADRRALLADVLTRIEMEAIEVVRVAFVDMNGIVRSRPIEAHHFAMAAQNGVPFTTALFAMDTANFIIQNVFAPDGGFGRETLGGAGDMLGVPDLTTFRILPWADRTAFVLCDLYLKDGQRCPYDPRWMMQRSCARLAERGFDFVAGVELEAHLFRVTDPKLGLEQNTQPASPPAVEALRHAFQHLSDAAADGLDPILSELRRAIRNVGLPLRTLEVEWGPGQIEVTLDPMTGVAAADAATMLRTTIKQVSNRMGILASFMARPALPNAFSSGWHLHQSLSSTTNGGNAFADSREAISAVGRHYIGGLLAHAPEAAAFANPTINGYKRLNSTPLSPKLASWALDNKGAMLRVMGYVGDPSVHVENRLGEPSANPYLYMASQICAGLDGLVRELEPGQPAADPCAPGAGDRLPGSLAEAVGHLSGSELFRREFGDEFIEQFTALKRHEIRRFEAHVTDWEHREYFELF